MKRQYPNTISARLCGVTILVAGAAVNASAMAQASQPAPTPTDDSLTFHGITLYGTVDIGLAYMTHGAPLSSEYGPGLPFFVQKFNNKATTSVFPNGLSQSRIGLSGAERINDDLSAIIRLETGFQPTSGRLTNGPGSLINNNGKAVTDQTTAGDSSRAGQPLNGPAYIGINSKMWGTLTFGRQNSLLGDDIAKYDPQQQAQSLSPIGYSGVAGGGGATEDLRLDSSVKYIYTYKIAHIGYLHQFGSDGQLPGGSDSLDVGFDYAGFSFDATYAYVQDAVAAASLSASQNAAAPGTLAATISDNRTYSFFGRYVWGPAKFFAGYEHISFANPSVPIAAGKETLNDYVLSNVNNTAYDIHKILRISWTGVRYSLTKDLDLVAAYYRYDQGNYNKTACHDTSASTCSGTFYDISGVADYKLSKRFDTYLGVNFSSVADGLASGFLQTSALSPLVGVRFQF